MKNIFLVTLLFLFAGCAGLQNPYNEFYQDRTGGIDVTKSPMVILPTGEPMVYSGGEPKADAQKMLEDGYTLLGFSTFNAGNVSKGKLLDQAVKIKASVVIFYSQYTNTISGVMPLILPNNQTITTNSSGSGNMYGNINGYGGSASWSGSGNYFGNSTTTVYGTQTTYIPYSQNRYDYFASYWIKMKPPVLGAVVDDLTTEQRDKIGTNKGVTVIAVVNDSPAFRADIFKGDIITKVNDDDVFGAKDFNSMIFLNCAKKVTLTVVREDKTLTKEVQLSEGNTLEDEKYGLIPEIYSVYHSQDPQFHKTAKIDTRKIFDNYKKSKDAGLAWEQLSWSQKGGYDKEVAEIFMGIKKVIAEYAVKNQYRAIYSVRMPKVNESEDLTDTIIAILNTQ